VEDSVLYLVIRPVVGGETEAKFTVSVSEQVPSYEDGWSNQAISEEEANADAGFSHVFTLDYDDARLQRLTNNSSLLSNLSYRFRFLFAPDKTYAKQYRELGTYLYNLLFADTAGLALSAAIGKAREQGNKVTLRLVLGSAIINTIPWENVYYPPEDKFLALLPEVRMLRWMPSHVTWSRQKVVLPLRVLLVDCRHEEDSAAFDPASLKPSLDLNGILEAEVLRYDGNDLVKALSEKVFHVVHFFAEVESSADVPYLTVYEYKKIPIVFGMRSLTSLLYGNSVRLLTLTPLPSKGTPWNVNFFGARLQETGVPAVLTTQVEPSAEGFADFIKVMYSSLAEGLAIDQALSNAEQKLALRPSDPIGAFALFLNTRDNQLFELVNPEVKEAEAWRDSVLNAVQQIVNVAGSKTIGREIEKLMESPEFDNLLTQTKSKAEGA
jgi:hypothetical protein